MKYSSSHRLSVRAWCVIPPSFVLSFMLMCFRTESGFISFCRADFEVESGLKDTSQPAKKPNKCKLYIKLAGDKLSSSLGK